MAELHHFARAFATPRHSISQAVLDVSIRTLAIAIQCKVLNLEFLPELANRWVTYRRDRRPENEKIFPLIKPPIGLGGESICDDHGLFRPRVTQSLHNEQINLGYRCMDWRLCTDPLQVWPRRVQLRIVSRALPGNDAPIPAGSATGIEY
jgi:hypothetical protein